MQHSWKQSKVSETVECKQTLITNGSLHIGKGTIKSYEQFFQIENNNKEKLNVSKIVSHKWYSDYL